MDGSQSLENFSVSADGRYLTYGKLTDGNPRLPYRTIELATGDELEDVSSPQPCSKRSQPTNPHCSECSVESATGRGERLSRSPPSGPTGWRSLRITPD
ncbi:MAG: hypothetical protein QOH84_3334 [Kribbellaceae bacterium]|nr:hypothetical protein [Kribbellaceae bacterium]